MRRFFWLSDKELDALIAVLILDWRTAKLLRWAEREKASR